MKKSYQGYIESENFGQYQTFVAFKIAIENWSVYPARVNNRYKLNFFLQNSLTKIYKLGLEMKKSYQGYIETFGQYRTFVAFKIAIEDWSVYPARVNNSYKLNFSPKQLNQNLQTRAWNEEKLPRIH